MTPAKAGLLAALFDFAFAESVTLRVAKGLYAVMMAAGALLAIAVVGFGFAQGLSLGLLLFVTAAVGFLLFVGVVRLWLEAVVVLGRIAERTEEIAEQVAGIAVEAGARSQPTRQVHAESTQP